MSIMTNFGIDIFLEYWDPDSSFRYFYPISDFGNTIRFLIPNILDLNISTQHTLHGQSHIPDKYTLHHVHAHMYICKYTHFIVIGPCWG